MTSLEDVLTITSESFAVMNNAIENAKDDLDIIDASLDGLHLAFDSINESLDLSGDLIGDDLRLIAINSQTALYASSTAAEVIHNTLSGISKIRLLGLDYAPEVPLHIGLVQIADNLSEVPDSLDAIEQSLDKTNRRHRDAQHQAYGSIRQYQGAQQRSEDAQKVLNDYEFIHFNKSTRKSFSFKRSANIFVNIVHTHFRTLFLGGLSQISILIMEFLTSKVPCKL